MEKLKTQNSQHDIEKKNKTGGMITHSFKVHYKSIVFKSVAKE